MAAPRNGSPSTARPAGVSGRPALSIADPRLADPRTADPRSRDRDGRPITGTATLRQGGTTSGNGTFWYPWYSSGFNWYYRYPSYGYNPWFYGSTWGAYGLWYDPFYGSYGYAYDPWLYDPYGYGPPMYGYPGYGSGYGYGGGYGGGSSSDSSSSKDSESVETGSIRLRVKPSEAQVYLDGTLIGKVDDFDGLTSHLAAKAGQHQIELRADGYEPLKLTVEVEANKTLTTRASMKKQKF